MKNEEKNTEQFTKLIKLRPGTHRKIKSFSADKGVSMYDMIDKILNHYVEKVQNK